MPDKIEIKLKKFSHGEDLPTPFYATEQSAGADLYAAIEENETLKPGQRKLIPTGFAIALPENSEAQIRPRSGLAYKNGITVLNTPGTIDADYRGEIKVLLINFGEEDFTIERGMRIAQMIIAPVTQSVFEVVDDIDSTKRGDGGFGSTGVKAA